MYFEAYLCLAIVSLLPIAIIGGLVYECFLD